MSLDNKNHINKIVQLRYLNKQEDCATQWEYAKVKL
jgi:hypothetical protein